MVGKGSENMSMLRCNSCGRDLGERPSETDRITKCPFCDSKDLSYILHLVDRVEVHERLKGTSGKIPGKKKPAMEFQAGEEKSVALDKWVNKDRVIDRKNDVYHEKVVDPDSGTILHECTEPLSEHFGHGSAKNR